jgi:Questin oxidase-like
MQTSPCPNPLHAVHSDYQHLPPEYANGLSNHLPMALQALHALGADGTGLQSFAQRYAQRFEAWPYATAGQPLARWQDRRGDITAFADLRASFAAAIAMQGAAGTLQQVLPDLWPGVAGAAFHGLIRTAHAMQAQHDGELAGALAYWAARWQPLQAPPVGEVMPMAAWSSALAAQARELRLTGHLISGRVSAAQQTQAYVQLAGRLVMNEHTLPQLAGFAVQAYSRSGNFTVLHMVTACRAARVLLALVPEQKDLALQALVPAFTAAYLASGVAAMTEDQATSSPDVTWPEVISAALQSDDDHVIKLVHACVEEAAVYGPSSYLAAAQRATARQRQSLPS